ncbi:hypothetical protein IIC_04558 [Bacillus cereus VD021]|uniref:MFS transporter n=1 Tax=Bacillus cereus VD021 TaxID=1053224 RepID=R8HCW5_BACCE|nr:MFS transporter [Bacillus cereus]EOO70713.1 hypothetical protein IIC_04558 [Bacillus cereus VD021]
MPIQFIFIVLLALTLCGEGMLTVTLTWTILDKGGSVTHLGIILTLMSLLPFFMQKYSKSLKMWLTKSPLLIFSGVRCIGIILIIISLLNSEHINVFTLYIFAGVFSIILFLSTQSLETYMSQMVLSGEIPAGKASNMLQTAIQIGAFGGNAIAGFMMNVGGFNNVLYGLAFSLGIGVFLPLLMPLLKSKEVQQNKKPVSNHIEKINPIDNSKILWITITGIAVLTIQLASFNFLVPILFHDVYRWDPMQYGFVSAAAGLGALLATLVGKFEKFIPRSIFILIAVFDITLGVVHSWYLAIAVSFMLGFVFNRSRINQRTVMFDFIKTKEETVIWSSRSTLAFQFTKAALPLTLALPIQWIGIMNAGHLFGVIGTIVAATMMVIYLNELNHRKKIEVLQQEVAPKSF